MLKGAVCFGILVVMLLRGGGAAYGADRLARYYAHETVEDAQGVIAPWYQGLNGQFDCRVRVGAETLKRYPWTTKEEAAAVAPHYVFNGQWAIADDGTITIPKMDDWSNGDQSQRVAYILSALVDYYRYTGDAAAIAMMTVTADTYLDHCLTGADHEWPQFPISVPVKGKPYGDCSPEGYMQLDIAAEVGLALLRAYEITGNERWFDAVKHWGDLFATYVGSGPDGDPWGRYAYPEQAAQWSNKMTGGVTFIIVMLDELIRLGYTGENDAIVSARDVGVAYLRDVLLPKWTGVDTWGRNYWDWECSVQCENVTEFFCRYLMANPEEFPNWRTDARNIMGLFLNRTSVSSASNSNVYSGAWAYPESSGCCGRSLWYPPMEVSTVFAEYGVRAESEWGMELARRQQLLATYGFKPTGVVEDNIDGGQIVAGAWFKITHPMALKHVLGTMAWLPEVEGANRENHIMRSSAVVSHVVYDKGRVAYTTYDAPKETIDVLRLAFLPTEVSADGNALALREDLKANGYVVKKLSNGDCIVSVRHDGARAVEVTGGDPQQVAEEAEMTLEGGWQTMSDKGAHGGALAFASAPGASMTFPFAGNQVRLMGRFDPEGGLADVYVDGEKQRVGIDCWNPVPRNQQVLYYLNGFDNSPHELKIVVRGEGNPIAPGKNVYLDAVQWSDATGDSGYGAGRGPTDVQRWVFGYSGREPLVDQAGHEWLTGVEYLIRLGNMVDSVAKSWWETPRAETIENTESPELYRYGIHGAQFGVNVTVGPGTYYAHLKLAETRDVAPLGRAFSIAVNGEEVVSALDVATTAGGMNRAVDLVFNDIKPRNGVIEIALEAFPDGEAILQALEVGPGNGGEGAVPVNLPDAVIAKALAERDRIANSGFEKGCFTTVGGQGHKAEAAGWHAEVLSPATCYVWCESAYAAHPDWGGPVFHSGAEALRTHSDGPGHVQVWQEVKVESATTYTASVWVHPASLHEKGFGTSPSDSAGLILEELGADGSVLKRHDKVEVKEAADQYVQLATRLTTSSETVRVRYLLDTVIAADYKNGHVTYDDCSFKSVVE